MKTLFSLLFLSFYLIFLSPSLFSETLQIQNGILSLDTWEPSIQTSITLNKNWEFYWGQFIPPTFVPPETIILKEIRTWSSIDKSREIEKFGFASYRLTLLIPERLYNTPLSLIVPAIQTSYRLYINSKLITEVGKVGSLPRDSIPHTLPRIIDFSPSERKIEILLHVSNFHYREGGIISPIILAKSDEAHLHHIKKISLDIFLFGSLFIMGLYHSILFFIRRKETFPLYFALFSMIVGFRLLFNGEQFIQILIPSLSWNIIQKISYLSFYLSLLIFIHYLQGLFRIEFLLLQIFRRLLYSIGYIIVFITLFTSVSFFSELLVFMHIYTIIIILYTYYLMIIALKKKEKGIRTFFLYSLLFSLSIINDILNSHGILQTGTYANYGLIAFIYSQTYFLSFRLSMAFNASENSSLDFQNLSQAYSKFIPERIFAFFPKNKISSLQLGEKAEKEMNILIVDIRSFKKLSKTMSIEENFKFINSYLGRISPYIYNYNGFVDTFIGDDLIAFFSSAENALLAAIDIQTEIRIYNHYRMKSGYEPIQVGIGIHYGSFMLGLLGYEKRIEGTLISEALNFTIELQTLAKLYNSHTLISQTAFSQIPNHNLYKHRLVDRLVQEGKEAILVYEIYNGISPYLIELKEAGKEYFNKGIEAYFKKDYKIAIQEFMKAFQISPGCDLTKVYLKKCQEKLGIKNWSEI